jgi:hypothetical protein
MLPLSLQFRVEEENMPETNGCISKQMNMESNGLEIDNRYTLDVE